MKRYDEIALTEQVLGNELWDAVTLQLKVLTKAGYDVVVSEEAQGIIVLKFAPSDNRLGTCKPYFITEDELLELHTERVED